MQLGDWYELFIARSREILGFGCLVFQEFTMSGWLVTLNLELGGQVPSRQGLTRML